MAYAKAVGQASAAGEAGPSAAAAGEASDSGEGEQGDAGGEAAAAESSSEEEEAASPPLRAPSCKTLGCSLRLWHEGPCSTAVTGKRARVLTDKAREAKRGKGAGGRRGGGGGGGSAVASGGSGAFSGGGPDASAAGRAGLEAGQRGTALTCAGSAGQPAAGQPAAVRALLGEKPLLRQSSGSVQGVRLGGAAKARGRLISADRG